MNFETTYQDKTVIVDYSDWSGNDDLEGVEITFKDSGEQIDYDNIDFLEWGRLLDEVEAEAQSNKIDSVMGDHWG